MLPFPPQIHSSWVLLNIMSATRMPVNVEGFLVSEGISVVFLSDRNVVRCDKSLFARERSLQIFTIEKFIQTLPNAVQIFPQSV